MSFVHASLVTRGRRLGALAVLVATMSLAGASPAKGIAFIAEDEVISSPGRELIHIRIQEPSVERGTCEGVPADRVEVHIPEGVYAVLAEAVPGWTVETEITQADEYEVFGETQTERVSVVRWTGGSIPEGAVLDFGIYAVFSEPQNALPIPVIEGCGPVEQAWTEVAGEGQDRSDLEFPAPVVDVIPEPTTDLQVLQAAIEDLRGQLNEMRDQVEEAPGPALRGRVAELEERLQAIEAQLRDSEGPEGE